VLLQCLAKHFGGELSFHVLVHSKAEQFEELVRELYEFEPVGIVADFVNAALGQVDWVEIMQAD
jgi:hypothetical protein